MSSYITTSQAMAEYYKADAEWCRLWDLFHRVEGRDAPRLKTRAHVKIRERERELTADISWAASNNEICLMLMTASSDALQVPEEYLESSQLGDAIRIGSAEKLNLSDEYAAWRTARLIFEREPWHRWAAKPEVKQPHKGNLQARAKPPRPTQKQVHDWYKDRVRTWPICTTPPNRTDDTKAAAAHFEAKGFCHRGLKNVVRNARATHAPDKWTSGGPKGRKLGARERDRPK